MRVRVRVRGTYFFSIFSREQEAICHFLTDWQNAKPTRALITLGGDVHMGGYTDSWVSERDGRLGLTRLDVGIFVFAGKLVSSAPQQHNLGANAPSHQHDGERSRTSTGL